MENNNQPNMEPMKEPNSGSSLGPAVGTIIIVAVLIIGGLYYWGAQLNKQAIDDTLTGEDIAAQADASLDALSEQGTSDEVDSIEEDLNLTDLDDLDAELDNIDAEFGL